MKILAAASAILCLALAPARAQLTTNLIHTTNIGDSIYENDTWPGGSYKVPNITGASIGGYYSYYVSSGTYVDRTTGYAQFALAGLDLGKFVSATLNVYMPSAATNDGLVSVGTINHVANSSSATGTANQRLSGTQLVYAVQAGDVGWLSFDITPLLLADLTNAYGYSCFSFDYGSGGSSSYRNARYSITSSEGGANALYLNVQSVPEPSTVAAIMGFIALPIAFIYRRRRAA
jgi:hypothetical protein